MMNTKYRIWLRYFLPPLLMILVLLLSACGIIDIIFPPDTPTPQSDDDISNINIGQAEVSSKVVTIEEFNLDNCGAGEGVRRELETEIVVGEGIEIGANAVTEAGVEVALSPGAKAKLGSKFQATFEQNLSKQNTRRDKIEMKADKDAHVIYNIEWTEETYASDISFVMNGEEYRVPYSYKLRIPDIAEENGRIEKICPDQPNAPPAKPVSPIPKVQTIGIAGSNDHVYVWYQDGTVSSGTSGDLDAYLAPYPFTLPPDRKVSDIIGIGIAGSNDHVYVWYQDGTVSSGTSGDLDAYRAPYPFTLPPDRKVSDIIGIGIAGSNDHVYVWYQDGTVSTGTSGDLDAYSYR